jgi:hypothetical protein
MADKSLFDIAKELYQGFGNNPANRELANTLTFRAPVVRELNPLVTVPRGINTLRDTDYGAIKDFLTGKYQIANDPRASLQRAGQATLNLGEGALDAAPVLGLVKPAIAGAKAAAPYVAEAAVNKMIGLEQKYGLPTSPTMNIVKPEGNLNLTTRLDERIKGPETQTAQNILTQARGRPGVTSEGVAELAAKYSDPNARVSKQEFIESIPPSKYNKVDLTAELSSDLEHYNDIAMQNVTIEDSLYEAGIPYQYHPQITMLEEGEIGLNDLTPEVKDLVKQKYGLVGDESAEWVSETIRDRNYEFFHNAADQYAADLMQNEGNAIQHFEGTQRLLKDTNVPHDYVVLGVTHPAQPKTYRHFEVKSDEGLIGHVRGSHHLSEEPELLGGVKAKPNSLVVEEIQSDIAEKEGMAGHRQQVYGTLVKTAVQDAAERGADYVYIPTSKSINLSSDRTLPSQKAIVVYDRLVKKEGIDSLKNIPGVEISPIKGESYGKVPMYYEIKLSPEAREYILTGPGQASPGLGYAAGGLVANDYDEEQIDRMSDEIFNFAEGGVVDKIARAGRKGQYKIAELIGLRPEVEFATEIPERYYPANEQHNARGDAMRHMLLQAQLMQKYGETPAKIIGWMHENLSGPQGDAEKAMDEYNDRLGREIGRVAKDKADMAYRAMQAIDKKQAKTLTKEQMGEGYAEGGLVYNDEEINNLADQLLGA